MPTAKVNITVETKADMRLVINSADVPLSPQGKGTTDAPLELYGSRSLPAAQDRTTTVKYT